jgi:MFS transporter, CP family, cyanate transporter
MSISLMEAGFLLSLVQLAGMSLGLAVGLLADAMGLRRCMLTGLGLLFVAGTAGAASGSAAGLLVLRALEGLGFLLVVMPAPGLLRQLVSPNRLSGLLGLWGTYMPLGTALALLVGPLLMAGLGWQAWWLLLAALTLAMAVLVWRYVPSDAERHRQSGVVLQRAQLSAWPLRLRQTLGARGPWLVALCFAMYSGQWLSVIGFLPTIYAEAGLTAAWTGILTALAAAANMLGNAASGQLLQRGWAAQRLLTLGFACMGLGAWLTFFDWGVANLGDVSPAFRYAAVLIFSGVGGVVPGTLFSLAVRVAPGESSVSTTVGWMQQLSAMGQFVGPPLVAWLAQSVGGWRWTWLMTGACSVIGLLLAASVGRLLRAKPGSF